MTEEAQQQLKNRVAVIQSDLRDMGEYAKTIKPGTTEDAMFRQFFNGIKRTCLGAHLTMNQLASDDA